MNHKNETGRFNETDIVWCPVPEEEGRYEATINGHRCFVQKVIPSSDPVWEVRFYEYTGLYVGPEDYMKQESFEDEDEAFRQAEEWLLMYANGKSHGSGRPGHFV